MQPFRFQVFPAPLRVASLGEGEGKGVGRSRAKWVEWRGQTEGNETTFSLPPTVVLPRWEHTAACERSSWTRCPQVSTGVSFRIASAVAQTLATAVLRPFLVIGSGPPAPPPAPEPGPGSARWRPWRRCCG